MTLDILRKTGGWCVELQRPLMVGPGREITQVEIRPTTADHMIRWMEGRIPSTLALLAELSDVPEPVLRQLLTADFDRVLMALHSVLPPIIKKDWEEGSRPLSTPEAELDTQQYVPAPDQIDPRFPAADGPVVRMGTGPLRPPQPDDDVPDMNLTAPSAVQLVR